MASILNVDKIRATGSTTDGLTIDSSGNTSFSGVVSNGVRVAVYRKHSQVGGNSGAFRDRTFDSEVYSNISGTSLSSGRASLPAGTYLIQYSASCVNTGSAIGECVSRVYNHTSSAAVSNSYSTRNSSVQANTTIDMQGSFVVTLSATSQLGVQTLSENGNWDDYQSFDSSPGNTLGNDGKTSVLMTVIQLAV